MLKAVYPGSFDPITKGHLDIIIRSSKKFDKLVVGVVSNSFSKLPSFSVEERIEMIKTCTENMDNVEVKSFSGFIVEFASQERAGVIIKGLRDATDFDYELKMAMMNKKLDPDIETMFIMSAPEYSFYSSTSVKEVARYHGDIKDLVPIQVVDKIRKRLEPYK